MTVAEQFDFFEDPAITALRSEMKESIRKTQKNLFGKHGDLVKMLLELLHRVEQLEGSKDIPPPLCVEE
jgi:hypothetical protein